MYQRCEGHALSSWYMFQGSYHFILSTLKSSEPLERSTCKNLVTGQVTFLNPWSRWYMNIVLHSTNWPYGWTQKPVQSMWLFDLFTPNFESKSLCSHRILGSWSPTNPHMNPAVWIVHLCLAFMHSTKNTGIWVLCMSASILKYNIFLFLLFW